MGKDCGCKLEKPDPISKVETKTTPEEREDALGNIIQTDNNKTYSKYNYNALNRKTDQTLRKHFSYTMISYLREKDIEGRIRISKQDSSFVGVDTKGKMSVNDFDNLRIKIDTTSNDPAYDFFSFKITSKKNGEIVNLPNKLNNEIIRLVNTTYNAEVNKILKNWNSSVKIGLVENNMTVDVKHNDSEKYYRATIVKKINDNKYDVLYQNGKVEMRVDKERIRTVDRIKTLSELVGPISKIINKVLKTKNKDFGGSDTTYFVDDVSTASSSSCLCCVWNEKGYSCGCCPESDGCNNNECKNCDGLSCT
jgi:hypothetical protein